MKMGQLLFSVLGATLVFLAWSQNASAAGFGCSASLDGVVGGNKTLTIQLDDHGKKKFAVDDDGYLVLSLIAAHCNGEIPWPKLELAETQRKCAEDAQQSFNFDEKVNLYSPPWKGEKKSAAADAISRSCGFQIYDMWAKVQKEIGDAPLKCAESVRPIISRAVARAAEFSKENMTSSALAAAGVPASEQGKYVEADKKSLAHAREFEKLLASSPVKTGDFQNWVEGIRDTIKGHAYQMLPAADAKPSADTLEDASGILMKLGARLPDIPQSRCGMFPRDLVDQLKDATWKPGGGSAPSTGSGTGVKR